MSAKNKSRDLSCYLSDQVLRAPHALALTAGDTTYDYLALGKKVESLAETLRTVIPKKHGRVGVYLSDKLSVFLAMLAIFKSDLIYVPIDVHLPIERCRYIIKDSDLAYVITDDKNLYSLIDGNANLLRLDACGLSSFDNFPLHAELQEKSKQVEIDDDADKIAYILYTSGSTGNPKGVEMSHRAILNLIDFQLESDALFGIPMRTLQFASPGFDVSCQEVLSSLACGGELVIIPDDVRKDTSLLFEFIHHQKIERGFLPYSVLQTLAIEYERRSDFNQGYLKHLITAGEQLLMTKEISGWLTQLGCRLINHYGPTETHVVTTYTSDLPFSSWPYRAPIGTPIFNVVALVLDESLNVCSTGTEGELYIGGVCLAKGYINLPDESASKYVVLDRGGAQFERFYRTGDIAELNEEGDLLYKGRRDTQVKLNGYRVELGEVEARLKTSKTVKESIAVVKQLGESSDENILIAFVVLNNTVSQESLNMVELPASSFADVVGGLPDFMVPKRIYSISRIPLTNNGKLDRHIIDQELDSLINVSTLVFDEKQTLVANLFSRLLKTSVASVDSNFFELGGNSLLAIKFIKLLEDERSVRINLTRFLRNPTVSYTASLI